MPVEVKVPSAGESISEVQLGSWLKKEGDFVKSEETLVEIETDKATMEVPAPVAGRIVKLLAPAGAVVKPNDVIAVIDETAVAGASAPAPTNAAPAAAMTDGSRVMPAAQRVLAQEGLQADQVAATGPGGRLLKEDVVR
ncbi:MAG: biotin/lipoyl-containing protein, partial [Planctomycetia bacterium]